MYRAAFPPSLKIHGGHDSGYSSVSRIPQASDPQEENGSLPRPGLRISHRSHSSTFPYATSLPAPGSAPSLHRPAFRTVQRNQETKPGTTRMMRTRPNTSCHPCKPIYGSNPFYRTARPMAISDLVFSLPPPNQNFSQSKIASSQCAEPANPRYHRIPQYFCRSFPIHISSAGQHTGF